MTKHSQTLVQQILGFIPELGAKSFVDILKEFSVLSHMVGNSNNALVSLLQDAIAVFQ